MVIFRKRGLCEQTGQVEVVSVPPNALTICPRTRFLPAVPTVQRHPQLPRLLQQQGRHP
jgi:hypothetical protein